MSVSLVARPRSGGATPQDILARIERLPLSSWQITTRIIVGAATFFDAFDALSIAYVLPVVVPLWKLAPGQIGTLISFGFLGQLIGALIGGSLAERFGGRPVIVVAVLWFGLMSLACGFAWSYQSLLVLRLLQGLGLGAEVPVAATYISELAKAGGRGRFVLLFELVFPLGLVAAAVLGRWIVPTLGWQYLFFVGGVPALFALLMMRNLPESPRWLASRGRSDDAADAIAFIEKQVVAATGKPLPPVAPTSQVVGSRRASWSDLFGGVYLRHLPLISLDFSNFRKFYVLSYSFKGIVSGRCFRRLGMCLNGQRCSACLGGQTWTGGLPSSVVGIPFRCRRTGLAGLFFGAVDRDVMLAQFGTPSTVADDVLARRWLVKKCPEAVGALPRPCGTRSEVVNENEARRRFHARHPIDHLTGVLFLGLGCHCTSFPSYSVASGFTHR
jgi:MFS family permease